MQEAMAIWYLNGCFHFVRTTSFIARVICLIAACAKRNSLHLGELLTMDLHRSYVHHDISMKKRLKEFFLFKFVY